MKTKVHVNTPTPKPETLPEAGQYYRHERGDIYLLVLVRVGYTLVNVRTGLTWTGHCTATAADAFGHSYDKFTPVKEVTINAEH